jgi:UDP-N-acetylmuramate dehydrogenase
MTHGYTLAWNVPLHALNTLRVATQARCLARVQAAEALPALLADPAVRSLPVLVLGAGSNVLFATPAFDGLVVHLECASAQVLEQDERGARVLVQAAHDWDRCVDWTLGQGLAGLENLALIPGQVGAAPIQNIGAYGAEVGESIAAVHVWDCEATRFTKVDATACRFGYRDSVFKHAPARWIVTAVEFRLGRGATPRLGYAGVQEELAAMGVATPTSREVAAAVRRIRRRKLPDPAVFGNAGSFFKNPIVPTAFAEALRDRHPTLPVHPGPRAHERKLAAAWLIEQAGWRGRRVGDAGVSAQHALVLVNHGSATGAQLLELARDVADDVETRFGVRLEPEPRIVGAMF